MRRALGARAGAPMLAAAAKPGPLSGRRFVCARCQIEVLVCSHCDRGQRYCGRECSRQARCASLREAGRCYQSSRAGHLAHARRARRYRQRQKEKQLAPPTPTPTPTPSPANIVTHQGSQQPCASDSLAAMLNVAQATGREGPRWTCRWCTRGCERVERRSFVRRGRLQYHLAHERRRVIPHGPLH